MSDIRIDIERDISASPDAVSAFVNDFSNAREWMVGIEGIERTGPDAYRLVLETPVGKLKPEARIAEHSPDHVRWVYTSTIEGEGQVSVLPGGEKGNGCVVRYTGSFRLKGRILSRAAKAVGMEKFSRRQGERSLERLKRLMEARRV